MIGGWFVRYPLVPAGIVLLCAVGFTVWSMAGAGQAREVARRASQNLERARVASESLERMVPRYMPAGGAATLVERMERSLVAAGADKGAVRSVNVQSLGQLTDVAAGRRQARVELAGLTMPHAATAIDAVESCGLPVWIESAELSASGGEAADEWIAVMQVNWITGNADAPPPSR
jgi:hypothetical protein